MVLKSVQIESNVVVDFCFRWNSFYRQICIRLTHNLRCDTCVSMVMTRTFIITVRTNLRPLVCFCANIRSTSNLITLIRNNNNWMVELITLDRDWQGTGFARQHLATPLSEMRYCIARRMDGWAVDSSPL